MVIVGQWEAAEQRIVQYLENHPNNPMADRLTLRWANLPKKTSNWTSASQRLEYFVDKYPDSELRVLADVNRVLCMYRADRNEDLIPVVEEALDEYPQHAYYGNMRFWQAQALYRLHRFEEASGAYRDAMEHMSEQRSNMYEVSLFRAGNGYWKWADDIQEQDPSRAKQLRQIAVEGYQEYLRLPPKKLIQELFALLRTGQYELCRQKAQAYLDEHPDFSRVERDRYRYFIVQADQAMNSGESPMRNP
jgi:tetratricopeptide (TPR) repeat protein